jgi:multidrug efflux system membrane fusion protein
MPEEKAVAPAQPIQKALGRVIGLGIIIAAILVSCYAAWMHVYRAETDDATVRANFIGVAPQVSGHIVKLGVKDDQLVKQGDLLFLIDPRPYQNAVDSAKANLSLTRKEVDALKDALKTADEAIVQANAQSLADQAELDSANADFTEADDHVKRLEPLLAKQYASLDELETERTRRDEDSAAVRAAQKRLAAAASAEVQAKAQRVQDEDNIGEEGGVNARIATAQAQLDDAELNLGYCNVTAPFSGKVVNFNISLGEYAPAGVNVFTLIDTGTWYVVANFRETQLQHIGMGSPAEIYLQSKDDRRYHGKVVGLGSAVVPEDGTSEEGLPSVPRNLDWVRLAQRFPVRIQVLDPDENFRIGASSVVTITGPAPPPSPPPNP